MNRPLQSGAALAGRLDGRAESRYLNRQRDDCIPLAVRFQAFENSGSSAMSVRLANLFLGRGFAALFACLVCVGCESSPPPASVSTGQPNKTPSVQIKDDQTVAVVPDKPDQSADDNQPGKVTQPTSPATDDAEDMPDDPGDNTAEPTETADGAAPTEPYVPESLAVAEEKLLVDAADLTRLDPESNVWVDKKNKRVVLAGEVCRRDSILEMFACLKGTKEHEAIVSVHCKAFLVHTGLLLVGAEPGHPVRFQPEYAPVEGPEIEITVLWHDEEGKLQEARAQDWIRNRKTGEALTAPFVFGGSGFWTNDKTGDQYYLARRLAPHVSKGTCRPGWPHLRCRSEFSLAWRGSGHSRDCSHRLRRPESFRRAACTRRHSCSRHQFALAAQA